MKRKKMASMLLIAMLILGMAIVSVGSEPQQTKLFVDPQTYTAGLLGEVFTIDINIANVTGLGAFEFKLQYNTTLLDAVPPIHFGPIPLKEGFTTAINETEGYVWVSARCLSTDGNVTLTIITFKVTYAEPASCNLTLYDTVLKNNYGSPIEHGIENGNYKFEVLSTNVATDKPYYLPGENVEIQGNLTQGVSLREGMVALEVDNPGNNPIVVRTLQTGSTPPSGDITILDVYTCDQWGTPQTSFKRGAAYDYELFYVNVTVKNNNPIEEKDVIIIANSYDVNNVPLGVGRHGPTPASPTYIWSAIIQVSIPEWASLGNATVYVNAFTNWPGRGRYGDYPLYGIPYCPEESRSFTITNGGLGGSALGAQFSGSTNGNYNLTFKLANDTKAGIYRVYAVSSYNGQPIPNSTVFGVNAIYVCPYHYLTIQEAVDAASPTNNSILVCPGTYNEHVTINKNLTLVGVNPSNTIINGGGTGTVVTVTTGKVEISRFIIQGSGGSFPDSGITLNNSSGSFISENTILNSQNGIYLTNSSQETIIRDNTITSNNGYGINLNQSYYTTFKDNTLIGNKYNFGVFGDSILHFIHDVDTSNTVDGKPIYYWISQQNKLVPSDAGYVAIVNSANITVRGINLNKNGQGILFAFTVDSLIERVNTINNEYGIYMFQSYRNRIVGSGVSNNTVGIYQSYCNENIICHNNITNNTNQVQIYQPSNNTWNDSAGKGNYWSNYTGVDDGSNNRTPGDGVGDTLLPHQGVDWYPLMTPWNLTHDIAITSVTFVLPCNETHLYPGWVINITVTVQNEGDFTETPNVTAYYDGNPIEMKVISELTPLDEIVINFAWDTYGVSPGNYTIKTVASVISGETHTTDNTYIDGNVTLLVPTVHDLNVTSATPIIPNNYSHVYSGWVINIPVIIINEGHFRETTSVVAYYNGNVIDMKIVTLYPLASANLNLTWDTVGVSPGNYTIKTVANNVTGETDIDDNTFIDGMVQAKLMGDVDGNGVVNVLDVKKTVLAWSGIIEGPMADLDGNGIINVLDVKKCVLAWSGVG